MRGGVTVYSYTNNLLSAVTLPDGTVRLQNQYDAAGRVTQQQNWNSVPYTVTYDVAMGAVGITRTLVTDTAQHNTWSYDTDTAGRAQRVLGHTTTTPTRARACSSAPSIPWVARRSTPTRRRR